MSNYHPPYPVPAAITDNIKYLRPVFNGFYFWWHDGFKAQVYHSYATFNEFLHYTTVPAMKQLLLDWHNSNGHLSQTQPKGGI